jgi:multiple sugar transport system substrate-binding protein
VSERTRPTTPADARLRRPASSSRLPHLATRRGALGGSALAGGAILGACAGAAGGEAPRTIKAPTTISYMTDWASGPRLKIVQDGVALFKQKYPAVTVDFQPTNEVLNKIITDLAAGTQSDVILYAGPLDAYADLMPFAKRDKLDLKQYLLLDPMLNANGTLLGLPFQEVLEPVWFYNRTLFIREGVAPPAEQWTWDTFADAAKRLTRPGDTWGLAAQYEKIFEGLLRSDGSDLLSPDRTRTTLNTAEAREAAQWIVDRIQRDRTMLALQGAPEMQPYMKAGYAVAFQTGRIAMGQVNAGWVGNLEASVGFTEFDWDLMPTPKAPRTGKNVPFLTDRPNGVTKRPGRTADQMDAAWLLTQFMSGPEVSEMVAEGRTSLPPFRKTLAGPHYLRKPPEGVNLIPKMVDMAGFRVSLGNWGMFRTAIFGEMARAWSGELSVDAALTSAAAKGDAIIQQYNLN